MKLLGIAGKKYSGKNTVADIIARQCSIVTSNQRIIPVTQLAFANELKDDMCDMLGVTRSEIENDKAMYREMLQAYGVYMRNKYGEDYWVENCLKEVQYNGHLYVITDVRFPNEYNRIKQLGGNVIVVARNIKSDDTHISETALDGYEFDATIINNGTLEDLNKEVSEVITKLKIK